MKFATLKELEEINEMEEVDRIEFNGMSGEYIGCYWYSVILNNGTEYQVYVK